MWAIMVDVGVRRFAGLVLTPGAGGRRTQSGLAAIDESLSELGIVVHRVEFPGQAAGSRRPDPPDVCIATVRDATSALARELEVRTGRIAIGGRSFGGRMCSLAAAQGLDVAGLVLVSYPLHPPDHPDRLRTSHFPDLHVPCLFVSGRSDAYATPDELADATTAIPGDVTITHVDGDHSLRRTERDAAAAVAAWALATSPTGVESGGS
jgi:uncharacterized protein